MMKQHPRRPQTRRFAPALLVLGAAACGSTAPAPLEPSPPARGQTEREVVVAALHTGASFLGAQARASSRDEAAAELAIWDSPRFRRAFAQGFLAETEVEPGLTADEREVLLEVRDLLAEEKVGKAIEVLEDEGGEAENAQYDVMLGKLYLQQDRAEEAARLFRRATEKFPRFLRAWRELGTLQVRSGAYEEGRDALTRVLELGGNDALTYGFVGFCHVNLGDYVPAETAFRMAALLDPETVDWQLQLTRALFEQRRFADAVAMCDTLIADDPQNTELWLLQTTAFLGLGEYERAAEGYELVDRLGGSTIETLEKLANLYMHLKVYDLAVDAHLRALQHSADAPIDGAARSVRILVMQGEMTEARRLLSGIESLRALSLDDAGRRELLDVRVQLAVAEGGDEEQAQALRRMIDLDPLDGRALILLGQYEKKAGDPVEAAFYFERAASISTFEAEAKVELAQLLATEGKTAEALALLRSAQQLDYREVVQRFIDDLEKRQRGR